MQENLLRSEHNPDGADMVRDLKKKPGGAVEKANLSDNWTAGTTMTFLVARTDAVTDRL